MGSRTSTAGWRWARKSRKRPISIAGWRTNISATSRRPISTTARPPSSSRTGCRHATSSAAPACIRRTDAARLCRVTSKSCRPPIRLPERVGVEGALVRWAIFGFLAALAAGLASSAALAAEATPTGQAITPTAAPGAIFQRLVPDLPDFPGHAAGQASALALSPDGRTLLILTSGYNLMFGDDGKPIPAESTEYVFVYDVGGPAPVKRQVIQIPNSFVGLAWAPDGARFHVSGGVDDDVLEYAAGAAGYAPARTFPLGHAAGLGLKVRPEAGELALSPDGSRLLVANVQNDSVSLIDLASGRIRETDLRPGGGRPGGSFPRAVVWTADDKAYVTSERDREIIALAVADDGAVTVERRIRTRGQPVALAANPVRGRLYAAADDSDGVSVVDTASDRIVEQVATLAPADVAPARANHLGGAGSNGLALSADGRTLLVSNGAENDIAVVRLDDVAAGARAAPAGDGDGDGDDDSPRAPGRSAVIGLIPTGWYPTAVALSRDGRRIFAVNGKSNTGPVPHNCRANTGIDPHHDDACKATNEYVWQKEVAGFLALPAPAPATLGALTRQVARNNRYLAEDEGDAATFAFLRRHIRHVIYIVKENRTYDQVLGDLEVGNGDPRLTVFPRAMTPNQHALARQFVDLDAFFDSGESSNTGWNWTTAARTNDFTEREAPVNYGDRGLQYDQEGDNRQINVGYATSAERVAANPASPADPNVLPGARDVAAPDGPDADEGRGYIWDAALRAGLSVRNYGFYGDLSRYGDRTPADQRIPRERDPHAKIGRASCRE